MKKFVIFTLTLVLISLFHSLKAQDLKRLTLQEVIRLSEEQSPNALMAKHRFRASYWQYRTFVAQYRPSLTLTGTTPDYSYAYDKVWNSETSAYDYIATNTLSNLGSLSLLQTI